MEAIVTDIDELATLVAEKLHAMMQNDKKEEDVVQINRKGLLSGLHAIAECIGVSKAYLSVLKKKGVFSSNAIWQESNGGKVYAEPTALINEFKQYCSTK